MESQHLSNVLLAAGQMQRRHFTPGFLNQALGKLLADGNTQELVNTLWSLSAMGLMKGNVFSSILDKLIQLNDPLTLSHARQILMVSSYYSINIIPCPDQPGGRREHKNRGHVICVLLN